MSPWRSLAPLFLAGAAFAQAPAQEADGGARPVGIAWFGPHGDKDARGSELDPWRAAEFAIADANRAGGFEGRPFRLIPVWSEDPWGTGIAELARVTYDQRVWALLGSPDGSAAHLVEQVSAKARLVFVNPSSTDQSANLANVPWIFSCAPSDRAIAALLARTLIAEARGGEIAIVSATDHDSRETAKALVGELSELEVPLAGHLHFAPDERSFERHLDALEEASALALLAPPAAGAEPLSPSLEDAYIHFMQSIGQDMSLEATAQAEPS